MNANDFLALVNLIIAEYVPENSKTMAVETMDELFSTAGIDSLDTLNVLYQLCVIYDIDDKNSESITPKTAQEMYELVYQHARRHPSSIAEAIEWCE